MKNENENKLPIGKFFAWKSRDISVASITVIVTGYLSIFCTDTLGMKPAIVGTILLLSKLIDMVTDFIAGYLVDNTNTKLGKGRPYELSIIGSWICSILLFSCPTGWEMTIKTIWIFFMYTMVFSVFNSFLGACHNPYMIRAFKNKEVVTKVASYGGIVTMLGSAIVSITFPIAMGKIATSAGGWRKLILLYAIPLAVIGLLRFIFVKEDPSIDAGSTAKKIDVKEVFVMFRENKYAWAYAGITGLYNLCVGMSVNTFYFKYIVGDVAKLSLVNSLSVLMLPIMFVFPKLMKKMKVSNLIELGVGIAIIGYFILFIAKANLPLLVLGNIFISMATLPICYLGVLVIMELATYNEWKGMPRMEGSTNIMSNFATKAFNGIGIGLQGLFLSAFGYVTAQGNEVVSQPDSVILAIRLLYSLIPMVVYLLIVFCATRLGKLEKQLPEMEAELAERKERAQE